MATSTLVRLVLSMAPAKENEKDQLVKDFMGIKRLFSNVR